MTDEVTFKSDIVEQFDEAETAFAEYRDEQLIMIDAERNKSVELLSVAIDFDTGRRIGRVRVETLDCVTEMLCEQIVVGAFGLRFIGKHDRENIRMHAGEPNE